MSESKLKFTERHISDQKRLVRGEHLLLARSLLQARDGVHHAKCVVGILAGGAPQEEITAIRSLMPKARIIAIDKDVTCLDRAIDAGADDVAHCDLVEPESADILACRFDVLDLDLCANATRATRSLVKRHRGLITMHGVLMATFSYGRDVIPLFEDSWNAMRRGTSNRYGVRAIEIVNAKFDHLLESGAPESVCKRINYLFHTPDPKCLAGLRSVMIYHGATMPMCSLLFRKGGQETWTPQTSFLKIGSGDFELAVVYPESADLYACPQDRIESLRRKFAAIKAAYTRAEKIKESARSGRSTAVGTEMIRTGLCPDL
jgi:hypothetical protein